MSFRQSPRRRGSDPALLRQLRGEPALSVVDQPATAFERAFAGVTALTMLLISAYLVLM